MVTHGNVASLKITRLIHLTNTSHRYSMEHRSIDTQSATVLVLEGDRHMTTTVPEETNETNDMPRPDVSKLPTIPTELPKVVLDYAETSSRGRVQIKHAKKFLADLNEYGPVILSQHHAEGAAELLLEESPEYEAQRAAISNAEADAQKYYEAYQKLQEDADNARAAIIAEIVAKSQGDTDFEEADIEYSIALTALSSNVKNFQAAGDSVYNALKDFVKNIPTSKDLVEGKRK